MNGPLLVFVGVLLRLFRYPVDAWSVNGKQAFAFLLRCFIDTCN